MMFVAFNLIYKPFEDKRMNKIIVTYEVFSSFMLILMLGLMKDD